MEEVRSSSPLSSTHYFLWSGTRRIGVISALCLVLTGRGGRLGGSPAARWALKRSSIAFAPRLNTGRNSLRYTFSVVRVFACPTRCAMSGYPRSTAARRNCAAALAASIRPHGAQSALGHLAECTPNVGCIERGAKLRREDKIIVGPSCRASHATLSLPASMRSKREYAIVRELKSAPRQSRLGVPALSH